MPVTAVTKLCSLCSEPAVLMCQRCFDLYCSVQCQTYDWPQHKRNCITMPKLVPATLPAPENRQLPGNGRSATIEGARLIELPQRPRSVVGLNLVPNRPMRPPLASDQVKDDTMKKIVQDTEKFTKPPPKITPISSSVKDVEEVPKIAVKSAGIPQRKLPVVKPLISEISPTKSALSGVTSIVKTAPVAKTQSIDGTEPKYWLQTRTLTNEKSPFEIIIHHVDDDGLVWAIESNWEGECNKLLREINKYCLANQGAKATPADMALNNIFAVNFEGAFYRAVVVKVLDGGPISVRLIDYGNEFLVQANALLLPSPIMKNLAPFVVKTRLKGAKAVQVEGRHLVSVICQDPTTGVYELQVVEPHVPDIIDMLVPNGSLATEHGKVTILALPKKSLALGILRADPLKEALKQLLLELPEKCLQSETCASAAVGDTVCCQLNDGAWCRVKVTQKHGDYFVVYGLDSGCFEFVVGVGRFKECPKQFAQIPAQTVLVEFTKLLVHDSMFYKSECFPFADVTITMREYDAERREIVCTLVNEVEQLAEAKIRMYDASLEGLGIPFWRSVAPTNSEVMITEIVNQQALYVCPADKCGVYRDLLKQYAGTIPTYTNTPQPSELVLATGKSGVVYRAKIQTIVSAVLGQVIDLDSGVVEELNFKHMAPVNDFIRALPIYTMLVKVDGVDQLSIEDRILVAEYWKTIVEAKKTLILSYDGAYQVGVKLLNATTKKNIMLDVQEMKVAKTLQALAVREITPTKDLERFMINDLVVREISVGDQVKVSLVDVSAVNARQLTICEFHKDNVMLYEQITTAVNNYGKSQAQGDAYFPRKGELCIAIFPADNEWYRAVSVTDTSAENPKATLLFIDYCNEETIDCKDIRKMTPDLMMHAVAHLVEVKGLNLPISKTVLAKLVQWQQEGSFIAKNITKVDDVYVLTMPEF